MPQKEADIQKTIPQDIAKATVEVSENLKKLDEHLKRVLGRLGRKDKFSNSS